MANISSPSWAASESSSIPNATETTPSNTNIFNQSVNRLKTVYTEGDWGMMIPVSTHHYRPSYTQEQIDSYEENPPGLGIAKNYTNASGNREFVYALAYQDSHHFPSWQMGYAWQAMWATHGIHYGLGYSAFILAREDTAHYLPFPGIVPMASIGYKNLTINTTFVPFSNVFFSFVDYRFQ
jgi:palmitoyl transferase